MVNVNFPPKPYPNQGRLTPVENLDLWGIFHLSKTGLLQDDTPVKSPLMPTIIGKNMPVEAVL